MEFFAHEVVDLETLIPCAVNSRTHSEAQVAQIAASIREFGFTNPVLIDDARNLIAGHGRVLAARKLGLAQVPAVVITGLDERKRRALVIADNKLALNAGWDADILTNELRDLAPEFGELMGFSADELARMLAPTVDGLTDEDAVPEIQADPISRPGDVWILDGHRVMCGDSTAIGDAEKLMAGEVAALIHADPPYGMGKEGDGVANDNLYREKLDAFQLEWWATFRTFLTANASAYIWGNAPDLWRLWYAAGLGASERFELRTEIVWNKGDSPMRWDGATAYQPGSERCLFFQFGEQFLGNINADDFPEQWEPLRAYMAGEAERAGVTPAGVKEACGVGMFSHWFTRSQFCLCPENHYAKLRAAYPGAFARPWLELKGEWDRVKGRGRDVINGQLAETRSYFDNGHDSFTEVWEFPRVHGEERHGHATPKPVAMMERIMRCSLPAGGLCVEPFGGSGSTLMGAEKSGRRCFVMELQPQYVDVIVKRWQAFTGKTAYHADTGEAFGHAAQS